jgi:hypothetical protein
MNKRAYIWPLYTNRVTIPERKINNIQIEQTGHILIESGDYFE